MSCLRGTTSNLPKLADPSDSTNLLPAADGSAIVLQPQAHPTPPPNCRTLPNKSGHSGPGLGGCGELPLKSGVRSGAVKSCQRRRAPGALCQSSSPSLCIGPCIAGLRYAGGPPVHRPMWTIDCPPPTVASLPPAALRDQHTTNTSPRRKGPPPPAGADRPLRRVPPPPRHVPSVEVIAGGTCLGGGGVGGLAYRLWCIGLVCSWRRQSPLSALGGGGGTGRWQPPGD